jgi:hypothetical protein
MDALGRSELVNPLSCTARITTPSTVGLAAAVMGSDWVPARAGPPFQWHHPAVHEGGVSISQGSQGWVFTKPDGRPWDWWVSDDNPAKASRFRALRHRQQARDQLAAVDSFQDPDARTIRPRWSSERFDLQASR